MTKTITIKHPEHGEVIVDLDQYLGKTGHGDWHQATHGEEQGWEPTAPLPEDDEAVAIEGAAADGDAPKGRPKGKRGGKA